MQGLAQYTFMMMGKVSNAMVVLMPLNDQHVAAGMRHGFIPARYVMPLHH